MTGLADGVGRLLVGNKIQNPLSAGELVEFCSTMDGGMATGGALCVVLKPGPESRTYWVKPLAAEDDYYSWHLLERAEVTDILIKVIGKQKELLVEKIHGVVVENVTSFRSMGLSEEPFELQAVDWLELERIPVIQKKIGFMRQMLCSDLPGPEKVSTPHLGHNEQMGMPDEAN
jgi:hypothetical protein